MLLTLNPYFPLRSPSCDSGACLACLFRCLMGIYTRPIQTLQTCSISSRSSPSDPFRLLLSLPCFLRCAWYHYEPITAGFITLLHVTQLIKWHISSISSQDLSCLCSLLLPFATAFIQSSFVSCMPFLLLPVSNLAPHHPPPQIPSIHPSQLWSCQYSVRILQGPLLA